jgi:Cadherin-like
MYVRQWTTGCLSCLVTTTVVIVFADVIGRRAERPGQVVTLSVEEERPAGTVVGDDLIREAGLAAEYPSDILSGLEFVLLDSGAGVHGLFQVDRKTGCLQTAAVIDREQFCRQRRVCILRLDIAVQPIKYVLFIHSEWKVQ